MLIDALLMVVGTKGKGFISHVATLAFLLLIIFLFQAISLTDAQATWQRVGTFNRQVRAGFFFNDQVGFIGMDDLANGILRTTDGGKTWVSCIVPGTTAVSIKQLYFVDRIIGFAALAGTQNTPESRALKTTDGGLSWFYVNSAGHGSDIAYNGNALVITSSIGSGAVSFDLGNTFTTGVIPLTNAVAFVDQNFGVATCYTTGPFTPPVAGPIGPWYRTVNGGLTWTPLNNMSMEAWGLYADKAAKVFYAAPEENPNSRVGLNSPVIRSNDMGATWQTVASLPFRTTGHIAGFGSTLYVQVDASAASGNSGLFRSQDGGQKWKNVGGPSGHRDTRFAITGCKGGVIYAFTDIDETGSCEVWKTTDGGDGTIIEPPLNPEFTPTTFSLSTLICSNTSSQINLQNKYCLDMQIVDVKFLDSTDKAVKGGALRFRHLPPKPRSLATDERDSVSFIWEPSPTFHRDTTITTKVVITYFSNALGRNVDTIVTITARAVGEKPNPQFSALSFNLDTITSCVPYDTLIDISNPGCDTLYFRGYSISDKSGVTLLDSNENPLLLPVAIPPGKSVKIIARIASRTGNLYRYDLTFNLEHQGIADSIPITLFGYCRVVNAWSLDSLIDYGIVSTCRTDNDTVYLKNLGCDTIRITSISFKNGQAYTTQKPTFPYLLNTGDSLGLPVTFAPNKIGPLPDSIYIDIAAYEITKRLVVRLSGTGAQDNSGFASTIDSNLNLHTYTRCDAPDSVVFHIKNPGCTRMTVSGVRLATTLAPVINRTVSPRLPVTMIDGDSLRVTILINPTQLGNYSGYVRVTFDVEGQPQRDTIIPLTINVVHGTRILSVDTVLRDLDTTEFCGTRDTLIVYQNLGCDSLYISDLGISSTSFVNLKNRALPIGLAGGESDTIKLRYLPQFAGQANGRITIVSDADSAGTRNIDLTAYAIPTDTVKLIVRPPDSTIHIGSLATLDIYPERTIFKQGLKVIQFMLSYNGDVLTPVKATAKLPLSNVTLGNEIRLQSKKTWLPVTITSGPDILLDSLKSLASITFSTTVSDSTYTSLQLEQLTVNNNDPQYAKCVLGVVSEFSGLQVALLCGDSTLVNFMRFGEKMPFSASPPVPNPFTLQTGNDLTIAYSSKIDGNLLFHVFDEKGNVVFETTKEVTASETDALKIPASKLLSGRYSYRVTLINNDQLVGVKMGKFVVIK